MLLCATCFAGCGSSSSDNTPSEENTQTLDMSTGIVKSIDTEKNQIVINVMDMSKYEGEPPTGEDGKMPSMPDGEPPEGFDGEMPSKPSGEPPTDEGGDTPSKPDGEMPQMEEKTYTISNSIYIQDATGNQITLEDVKEGDFVQFTVEGDEIATISLKKMDKDIKSKTEE